MGLAQIVGVLKSLYLQDTLRFDAPDSSVHDYFLLSHL